MHKDTTNIIAGTVIGLVVGIISTLFSAPESGSETRKHIKNKIKSAGEKASHAGSKTIESVKGIGQKYYHRHEQQPAKVDLNSASRTELTALIGVGSASADKIIRHREEKGPFTDIDELDVIYKKQPWLASKVKQQVMVNKQDIDGPEPGAMSI